MRNVTFVVLFFACFQVSAQNIPVIKMKDLEALMADKSKPVLVVNFWATWCAPCVKELPIFETVNKHAENTRVVLINLDFADKIDRVERFVTRKSLTSEVLLLDEVDYNSWIDKVDKSWQGAIPATLILNTKTGQRKFVAEELKEGQLEQIINEIAKG